MQNILDSYGKNNILNISHHWETEIRRNVLVVIRFPLVKHIPIFSCICTNCSGRMGQFNCYVLYVHERRKYELMIMRLNEIC